ncbi:MAG: L-2-amino-thiazoline-4-carboxylic acid hydrolase [Sandaracinaceae bacterium]
MMEQTQPRWEATDEATARDVLRVVRTHLPEIKDGFWSYLCREIELSAKHIARENRHLSLDRRAVRWMGLCSFVLSAYRELLRYVGGPRRARSLLEDALITVMRDRVTLEGGLGLGPEEPIAIERVGCAFLEHEQSMFGQGIACRCDTADEDHCSFVVRKCFFNDFFRRNGAPLLTEMFCRLDALWADQLAEAHHDVHFVRPFTLAEGRDRCVFEFTRVAEEA